LFFFFLSQQGKLFSWGAGESGQLGTGRCTKRDVPEEINLNNSNSKPANIACGSGHAHVILEDGSIYSWGLNYRGQCGLGDIQAKHYPVKITRQTPKMLKIFADGHSSAAVDEMGKLWTWGSVTHGRLLHPLPEEPIPDVDGIKAKKDMTIREPRQVICPALAEDTKVEDFNFSRERSTLIVRTTVTDIWPKKGPKRTFSKLTIHGYGFWESTQIIIKFTAKNYSIYNPPRSCLGKFSSSTLLTCKPPKFSETGFYTVTVSMDGGKEFLPQSFDVLIYKDMTLLAQTPSIIDLRQKMIESLTIKASALRMDIQDLDSVFVKLLFYSINSEEGSAPPAIAHNYSFGSPRKKHLSNVVERTAVTEITVKGKLEGLQNNYNNNQDLDGDADSVGEHGAPTNRTNMNEEVSFSIQCAGLDLSSHTELFANNGLFELQCCISMNSQDYATIGAKDHKEPQATKGGAVENNPSSSIVGGGGAPSVGGDHSTGNVSTLCHAFTPQKLSPNFYSLSSLIELNSVVLADQLDDKEKNVNLNEYNPFNPEANLIVQQREDKYHSYDCKIIIQGESFFPANKLPKGAHIKLITSKVIVSSLPVKTSELANAKGDETIESSFTVDRSELSDALQDLLVHCETKNQSFVIINYHYLQELYQFLSGKLFPQQQNNNSDDAPTIQLGLADYFIQIYFEFYLEFSSSEKLLLTKEKMMINLSKDFPIQLTPGLIRKVTAESAVEGDEEAKESRPERRNLMMKPKDLIGFPCKPTVYSVNLVFPQITVDNQVYEIPNYSLPNDFITFKSTKQLLEESQAKDEPTEENQNENTQIETADEQQQPQQELLEKEGEIQYYQYLLSIPKFPDLLTYCFKCIQQQPHHGAVADAQVLNPLLKTVSISFAFSENNSVRPIIVPLNYFGPLSNYSLQTPLPKGGFPSGTSLTLALEEYVPLSTKPVPLVRLRGNDENKAIAFPGTFSEIPHPTIPSQQQTIVTFAVPEANKLTEIGPIMNGKEKTFYIDLGLSLSSEEDPVFDKGTSPILIVK
jgi:hypothetical protein